MTELTMTDSTIKGQVALKRVGLKLKRLRKAHNYTQKEIAERLNLGLRSYQRIENRETIYDLVLLYNACSIYGVNFVNLANPYAPDEQFKGSFFNSPDEVPFEGAKVVLKAMIDLEVHPDKFNAARESKAFGRPLAIVSPFKMEYSGLSREDMGLFNEAFMAYDGQAAEHFWDEVIYHQPKFSVLQSKNGKMFVNRHFYTDSEEYTLSTIV